MWTGVAYVHLIVRLAKQQTRARLRLYDWICATVCEDQEEWMHEPRPRWDEYRVAVRSTILAVERPREEHAARGVGVAVWEGCGALQAARRVGGVAGLLERAEETQQLRNRGSGMEAAGLLERSGAIVVLYEEGGDMREMDTGSG